MDDQEKMNKVLKHLRIIRDKTINLDSYLNNLKAELNNYVVINSEGYKVSDIKTIQTSVNDVTSTFRDNTIPSIKRRIGN